MDRRLTAGERQMRVVTACFCEVRRLGQLSSPPESTSGDPNPPTFGQDLDSAGPERPGAWS